MMFNAGNLGPLKRNYKKVAIKKPQPTRGPKKTYARKKMSQNLKRLKKGY